jgi:hypothetical protein
MLRRRDGEQVPRVLSPAGDPDHHVGTEETVCCAVFPWAFARSEKLFFFPGEHLGRNTGVKKGIPTERLVLWDPYVPLGGTPRKHYGQRN